MRADVAEFEHILHDDPPAAFIAWQRASRAVSTRFDVAHERDRDILSNVWQWRLVDATAQSSRDETDHLALRAADRDGRDPAARRLRRGVDQTAAKRHLRQRRWTATPRSPIRSPNRSRVHGRTTRACCIGRRRAQLHRSVRVAAGADPQGLRPAVPGIPRDHALRRGGKPVATSALGETRLQHARRRRRSATGRAQYIATAHASTTICCRRRRSPFGCHAPSRTRRGSSARSALEALWRMVDGIRVGKSGYALIVGDDHRLIAHGNPDEKRARRRSGPDAREGGARRSPPTFYAEQEASDTYAQNGRTMVAVGAPLPGDQPRWLVIVEQPRDEAMATADQDPAAAARGDLRSRCSSRWYSAISGDARSSSASSR